MKFDESNEVREGCGAQTKNLLFLTKFMSQLNLTTGDIAESVGMIRESVTRWLAVDDTNLKNILKMADHFGYDFIVSYITEHPQEEAQTDKTDDSDFIFIEPNPKQKRKPKENNKNLKFLRDAMKREGITNNDLAEKMNLWRNSVQLWFRNDNFAISYIFKIARAYGWQVRIEFKLKKKTPKEQDT